MTEIAFDEFTITNAASGISASAQTDLPLASLQKFERLGYVIIVSSYTISWSLNDARFTLISKASSRIKLMPN